MDKGGRTLSALVLLGAMLMGCGGGTTPPPPAPPPPPPPPLPDPVTLTAVLNEGQIPDLVGEGCAPISPQTDPATPLFINPISVARRGGCFADNIFPVTAPQGDHVTFGEWSTASGTIKVTCLEEGTTRFDVEFEGLIADGVYTIWHFLATGGGALASHPDFINNVFVADAEGSVSKSVVGTPGPMTSGGTAPGCQLPVPSREDLSLGLHMVMLYHTDNRSWGTDSGPEETIVAHLVVMGR